MLGFLAKAAIPFLVGIVFALARKYLPSSANKVSRPVPRIDDLDVQFKSTQWLVSAVRIAVGMLMFVCLHSALVAPNRYFASFEGRSDFVMFPQSAIWFFLPGFAAITLTWEVVIRVWSWIGSQQTALL
jgi:hypothetical protein